AAAERTFCTAGSSRPMRIAMIAITTSNSISVNASRAPRPRGRERTMSYTSAEGGKQENGTEKSGPPAGPVVWDRNDSTGVWTWQRPRRTAPRDQCGHGGQNKTESDVKAR